MSSVQMKPTLILTLFVLMFALHSAFGMIDIPIPSLSTVTSAVSSVASSISSVTSSITGLTSWMSQMMRTSDPAASGKRETTDRYRHNYYINPVTRVKSNSSTRKRHVPLVMDMSPKSYQVVFMVYTKNNKLLKEVLNAANASQSSMFDREKDTKFILHDYNQSASDPMFIRLKNSLLSQNPNYNIILVDWEQARMYSYTVAATVSEYVGAMSARFLIEMKADFSKIHAIGFGLGAHAAGVMGYDLDGRVRRITGLDPSLPLFRMSDDTKKLDDGDAMFVDVIHTDGGNNFMHATHLGMGNVMGHVDVFVNSGIYQPGCGTGHLPSYDELYCSHLRALELFLESVDNRETIVGCQCTSWDTFRTSKCDCKNKMIYVGDSCPEKARGKFYLVTRSESPYGMGRKGAYPASLKFIDFKM